MPHHTGACSSTCHSRANRRRILNTGRLPQGWQHPLASAGRAPLQVGSLTTHHQVVLRTNLGSPVSVTKGTAYQQQCCRGLDTQHLGNGPLLLPLLLSTPPSTMRARWTSHVSGDSTPRADSHQATQFTLQQQRQRALTIHKPLGCQYGCPIAGHHGATAQRHAVRFLANTPTPWKSQSLHACQGMPPAHGNMPTLHCSAVSQCYGTQQARSWHRFRMLQLTGADAWDA
jgi:hypothetical protein